MTTKEKAKIYAYKTVAVRFGSNVADELFPELKESEDERIRKEIITYLYNELNNITQLTPRTNEFERWISWLEKQGGHAKFINGIQVGDKVTRNENGVLVNLSQLNRVAKKQGEQKPAWSEEDETRLTNIIIMLKEGASHHFVKDDITKAVDFLKFLKDRAHPKQEWKQENTGDLTDFENTMMHIGDSFFGQYAGLDPNNTNIIKEQANSLLKLIPSKEWSEEDSLQLQAAIDICKSSGHTITSNWLKSLKLQKQWKPSKEQLETFDYYVDADISNKDKEVLLGLYNDLKQL